MHDELMHRHPHSIAAENGAHFSVVDDEVQPDTVTA
jgi:hypothetical protein